MNQILNNLAQVDPGQLLGFLTDLLKNPQANPRAFGLVLGGVTIVLVLIILSLVLFFLSTPEDAETYAQEETLAGGSAAASTAAATLPPEDLEPEPERERLPGAVVAMLYALAFLLVWIAGGIVTRQDSVCLSCHDVQSIHSARVKSPSTDPHSQVKCVSCHETSNLIASVTIAVPGRAMHYISGAIEASAAAGYGIPVANTSCLGCHKQIVSTTFTDTDRGIKVSHAAPLSAGALCTDCHVKSEATGVTNRLTNGHEPCLRCHDQVIASAQCSYCHTKDPSFAVRFRGTVTAKTHADIMTCSGCHKDQTRCNNCHGITMPHTEGFMHAGHAREAAIDLWYNNGRTCKRCHTPTHRPCSGCHQGTFPAHGVTWRTGHQSATIYTNGCNNCHGYNAWMVGRNFCAICHYEIPPMNPVTEGPPN